MSNTRPVGHPVWDSGDGRCDYPECGRRTAIYDGKLQHLRGSGGRFRGGVRVPPMPADKARRRVVELERDLATQMTVNRALLERIAELEIAAHPWVAVHAKLTSIEKAVQSRPMMIASPTHRRVKDGGKGGRQELRDLRRPA